LPDHPLLQQFQQLQRQIEQRAYEIFKNSGFTNGHDLDDWLKAESEFLHPAPLDIAETDSRYVARLEVPGFEEKEIEIAADADQVAVSAQHTSAKEQKQGKAVKSEQQQTAILRLFSLPSKIDPRRISKQLKDGVLQITIAKAPAEQAKAASA
jgi:HSP20 family protein